LEKGLNLSNQTKNSRKYIEPLVERDWLQRSNSSSPKAPNQKYITTPKGKLLLKILKQNEEMKG